MNFWELGKYLIKGADEMLGLTFLEWWFTISFSLLMTRLLVGGD